MRGSAAFRAAVAPGGVLAGPWVRNELWRRARAVPSLDLRFAENKSLVDSVSGQLLITFTRASTGTFVDSDGVIRSAGNDVPRFDHNPVTGESLGLLVEEQRQNLLLNSTTLSTQTVTVTAVAHTLSFNGTGTITLSGTSTAGPLVGTGANARVSLTFTPTAGSLTLTVSGSVTNANLEIGSFPTSWIPTTGTAATRTADVASVTGTNFSSWYRQDAGSVFVSSGLLANVNTYEASFTDNTNNNHHFLRYVATQHQVASTAGGVANTNIFADGGGSVLAARTAYTYGSNAYAVSTNGTLGAFSSTTGGIPSTIDRLNIGFSQVSGATGNLTIRRLTFWPRRLDNSTLQSITQ